MKLRMNKGVSQGSMSEAIGLSTGYITKLESGHNLPSMTVFLSICKYLDIAPKDFFNEDIVAPEQYRSIMDNLSKLDAEQTELVDRLIKGLMGSHNDTAKPVTKC